MKNPQKLAFKKNAFLTIFKAVFHDFFKNGAYPTVKKLGVEKCQKKSKKYLKDLTKWNRKWVVEASTS